MPSHHYHCFLSLAIKGLLLLPPHLILIIFSCPSSQDLIDYEKLTSKDKLGNLNLAFNVALRHLGVPHILNTKDITNMPHPNERSVMTYVAQLYNMFASMDKVEHARDVKVNFKALSSAERMRHSTLNQKLRAILGTEPSP